MLELKYTVRVLYKVNVNLIGLNVYLYVGFLYLLSLVKILVFENKF